MMINRFVRNKRGNFAAMFAVASIPVIGGIAMTIEYSNLSNNQVKLQNAVDATALFAGRHYVDEGKLPKQKEIRRFMQANFDGKLKNIKAKVVGDKVLTTAEAKAPAFFFGNMAPDVFNQTADATVPIAQDTTLEIAMVLDTTRSMGSDGKLDSLKVVAVDFIDAMKKQFPNKNKSKLKMGIVPFSNHVNVGLSNRNATWIDVPPDTSEVKEVCSSTWPANTDMTCHEETRYSDGVPYQANVCNPTDPSVQRVKTCSMQTVEQKWLGCVGSRKAPYTTMDGAYATRMTGIIDSNDWHCPSELTPLTDQITTLKSGINALEDRGETYMAPGVMWGLRILSPGAPFTQGVNPATMPKGALSKKIMIVMTDGDNSKSHNQPWDAANWGSDVNVANTVTKEACTAARDAGVTIYTIAFGTSISADGKSVMLDCAGDAKRYYPAADAKALNEAFKAIGASITRFRLSS